MKKEALIILIVIVFGIILISYVSASEPSVNEKINPDIYKSLEKSEEVRVVIEIKEPVSERGFI